MSATVLVSKAVQADTPPAWFDLSDTPSLGLDSTGINTPKATYWGAPCRDESFTAVYRDAYGAKTSQNITQCVSRGSYGHLSTYGLLFDGTSTAYRVYSSTGALLNFYPIPNTKHAFTTGYESNIYKYLYIYKDLPTHITPIEVDGGVERYQATEPHDGVSNRVYLPNGYQAVVQDQTLVYSQNGHHIFANMGRAQVLINVDTQSARILGDRTNYSSGAPKVKLAVNSDASLVFVGDNNAGSYKIYDTTNCTITTTSNPEVCPVRDISSLVNAVPNKRQLAYVRFIEDGKLELIVSVNTDTGTRGDRYILAAPRYQDSSMQYIALGDSFASGEGAYDYKDGTDIQGNKCHISKKSYTYLISAQMAYSSAESVACSGAKIKDVFVDTTDDYSKFDPQASGRVEDSFDEDIFSNYMPGYRWQYEFVERYKPEAITLSISGNNINFGKKLQYCILTQYNCFESAEQKAGILKEIKAQFTELTAAYQKIREVSPATRVYVIGYPSLALTGGDCALNVRLSEAELMLADEIVEDLNAMIKRAATREGMFFIDTTDAFNGHRLCEGAPGSTAVNGLTFGTDQPFGWGPVSSATFHPNKLGHELFAETILQQTNNLTAEMPNLDDAASTKDMPSRLNPTDADYPNVATPILEDGLFGELVK
ncbi:SGNH/GDSL hydrolase family protein, partial [Candidatus Saccharibacteria bacterium]|nr:SGNH/GDSL hydrolase family protein [Candidatus Saccharibacteria bacterium]